METMGGPGLAPTKTIEEKRPIEIKHLHGLDVAFRPDCPDKKAQQTIISILENGKNLTETELMKKISSQCDENNNQLYYVKEKSANRSKYNVDYNLGRSKQDPVNHEYIPHPTKRIRYALAGVLNEILISKRIKEIVASEEAQNLAKENGFVGGIKFAEPIMAVVSNKSKVKYLIYENIAIEEPSFRYVYEGPETTHLKMRLAEDLKYVFYNNGINPHDLRMDQFIISKDKNGKFNIYLIDIEAYEERETR